VTVNSPTLSDLFAWGGIPRRLPRTDSREAGPVVVTVVDAAPGQASETALLTECPEDLVAGAGVLGEGCGGAPVFIASVGAEEAQAQTLEALVARCGRIATMELPDLYPMGEESALRTWLSATPRLEGIPAGAFRIFPAWVAVAAGHARRGRVLLDAWVTVAGDVRSPGTFRVPLGTTVATLARMAGGRKSPDAVAFAWSGSRGRAVGTRHGISAGEGAMIFLPPDHPLAEGEARSFNSALSRVEAGCSRCFLCNTICPAADAGVRPRSLVDALRWPGRDGGPYPPSASGSCLECRLCDTVCPSAIPVGRLASEVAQRVRSQGVRQRSPSAVRFVPREAFARRLGIGGAVEARTDVRDRIGRVRLSLAQEDGLRVSAVVRTGEDVWKGQVVARGGDGEQEVRIHAPFSGRVRALNGSLTLVRERA
jgi:Na+-translocating ferredoxin:NAD+ oxidoreductase RnfC subunit